MLFISLCLLLLILVDAMLVLVLAKMASHSERVRQMEEISYSEKK